MARTKIDWADFVWNPVWGCKFNCDYCYARRIAKRFGKTEAERNFELVEIPQAWDMKFPAGSAVFVNSMSDVSAWTNEWIRLSCLFMIRNCSYIYLTKDYNFVDHRLNMGTEYKSYLGYTVTNNADIARLKAIRTEFNDHQFINIEPLLEPLNYNSLCYLSTVPAIIIGAETGSKRATDNLPNVAKWVIDVAIHVLNHEVKVFTKDPIFKMFECREDADSYRQLLWTTRKEII